MNWEKIRNEYESTEITMKALGEKYGINQSTIRSRKRRENWRKSRSPTLSEEAAETLSKTQLEDWEEVFCLEYMNHYNMTRAYLEARPNVTYGSARTEGSKTYAKPNIQQRLAELRQAKNKELFLDAVDLDRELIKIAFADMKDFVSFGHRSPSDDQTEKGNVESGPYVHLHDSSDIDGSIVKRVKVGDDWVEVQLYDKLEALKMLYERIGGAGSSQTQIIFVDSWNVDDNALEDLEHEGVHEANH